MKPLELPILHYTSDAMDLKDLGIDVSTYDCIEIKQTFYEISAIRPATDNPEEWTALYFGSDNCIVPKPYEEVKRLIELARANPLSK